MGGSLNQRWAHDTVGMRCAILIFEINNLISQNIQITNSSGLAILRDERENVKVAQQMKR